MSRKNSPKDFEFETCIGEGSYSKVYKAVSIHNHRTYAIKVLNKAHIVKEKKIKYVNIEKNTLNKLGHHPGIVTLHYTFQDSESLYYVIDFALNGELLSLIRKWGSLSESVTKYYTIQLVDAVEFIHSKGIIHRDLKPENILLNRDWKLMITDFGAAKILEENIDNKLEENKTEVLDSRAGSFVGTAEYVSPELLKYNQCGFECDYWAIGCIIFQLITGYPPFKGTTEYLTFEKIIKLDYKFPDYYIPSKLKHIVSNLLVLKPEDRYNINEIKNDEWFKDINWTNKDFIWKRKVPKFESYNPKFYSMKKEGSPILLQKTRFDSSKFYVPPGLQLQSNINSIPNHILQKQIMTPQRNQQAMNKALTQRLIMKNNELNLQQRNAASLASAAASASKNNKMLPKLESSNFQPVNRARSSTTSVLKPISTISLKKPKTPQPKTQLSLSSSGSSQSSVALTSTANQNPLALRKSSSNGTNGSTMGSSKSPNNTINSMGNLMKKSFSSNILNGKSGRSRSKSVTPPVIASFLKTNSDVSAALPLTSVSDIPLLSDEYILKADSIYKSELPFSLTKQQRATLDDTVLNKLIDENYDDLCNELKSSVLIITSLGRLLVYEFSPVDDEELSTLDPKNNETNLRLYKETKLIVVNLTNKNISMYEFDGVFIIKDDHLPNIIFLSPNEKMNDSSKMSSKLAVLPFADSIKTPIKINASISWIDSLLKAKELLKSSVSSSPSSSSEFSSAENEVSVSPIDDIENGISRLSTLDRVVATPKLQQGKSSAVLPKPSFTPEKVRASPRSVSSSKASAFHTSSPQSAGPPRSSSNSSISYHYTQQQKSQPHAHQANFSFLSQTKQNKFASAAAAASFKK